MFDFDSVTRGALIDPLQVWRAFDSFWRNRTVVDTRDLVQFQSYASTILELNVHETSYHFTRAQTIPLAEDFLRLPWYPVVIFQDRLVDQSTVLYGGGDNYSAVPEIVYGEQGDPRFLYPLPTAVVSIGTLCDAITDTSVVIDPSQFTFDADSQTLIFSTDPFTLITPKTDATSGRQYIVLWMRNPQFDLNVAFDQIGWVLRYAKSGDNYMEAMKRIWELILLGPSLERYQEGLMVAAGLPYAAEDGETVRRVDNDGFQHLITTDTRVYRAPTTGLTVTVSPGDTLTEGQALTDGIEFMEYAQVLSATADQLPGLLLKIPLSTGVTAELSFANIDTAWTFDAGRPSPWRFPVGGPDASVEQFWADVDSYATANGIDFATLYGLPDSVNPMKRVVQDLIQNSLYVASLDLSAVPENMGRFSDRARFLLLPQDVLVILQQYLDDISDAIDLGTQTSDSVGYGYHAVPTTEVISVAGSGTDLEYFDYAPMVVIA